MQDKHDPAFMEGVRVRDHRYASTHAWAQDRDELGLRGEVALATYFGAQADYRSLPGGDNGVDLVLHLQCDDGAARWFNADAKAARKPYHLLVNRDKIRPATIYVLVGIGGIDECLGWEWGCILAGAQPQNWCNNGVFVHAKPRGLLRRMHELADRFMGWKHADVA